jgi:uncharacterized protein (TIGR02466 family)
MASYSFNIAAGGSSAQDTAAAFDLFPTRIWQARPDRLAGRLGDWIAVLEAMRAASPDPAGRTNRGGWNSRGRDLLDQPAFTALREAATALCGGVLAKMGQGKAAFTLDAWANIHDRGGFNFLHLHDGCLLSGVYYLQAPEGSGSLVFRDPRAGVLHASARGSWPNAYRDVQLRPTAGLMVIFPHWLEHFVEVHDSNTPRISIAFNAVSSTSRS